MIFDKILSQYLKCYRELFKGPNSLEILCKLFWFKFISYI